MSNKFEGRSKTFQTCKVSKNVPQALSTEKAVHKQRNTPRKSHEINFWLKMKDWTHASIFTPSRTKRYKKEIFKNSQWYDSKQKQLIRTEFWWGGMKMFWYWIVVMVVKFQEYDKNHWTDWERAPSSIFHPTSSTPSTLFLQMDLLSLLEHIIKKHIHYLPPTK